MGISGKMQTRFFDLPELLEMPEQAVFPQAFVDRSYRNNKLSPTALHKLADADKQGLPWIASGIVIKACGGDSKLFVLGLGTMLGAVEIFYSGCHHLFAGVLANGKMDKTLCALYSPTLGKEEDPNRKHSSVVQQIADIVDAGLSCDKTGQYFGAAERYLAMVDLILARRRITQKIEHISRKRQPKRPIDPERHYDGVQRIAPFLSV